MKKLLLFLLLLNSTCYSGDKVRVFTDTGERYSKNICDIVMSSYAVNSVGMECIKATGAGDYLKKDGTWATPTAAAAWGSIGGTLSSQLDLGTALSGKADTHTHPYASDSHNHDVAYEAKNTNIQTHIGSAHAPSNAQANADITKAEIEAKLTGQISSHSHAGGGGNVILSSSVFYATTIKNYSNVNFSTSTLGLNLAANTTYQFTFYAVLQSSLAATGIKPTLKASVAPGFMIFSVDAPLTAATGGHAYGNGNYQGTALATALAAMTNNVTITGTIATGGSPTQLMLMFAAEVADGYIQFRNGTAIALPTP